MASAAEAKRITEDVKSLTPGQVGKLLNAMAADPDATGLRRWLAGCADPDADDAVGVGATLTTNEAGELLDVERQRLWRWRKAGRIKPVAVNNSGPLFLRVDVERLKAEEDERGARRSRGVMTEEEAPV